MNQRNVAVKAEINSTALKHSQTLISNFNLYKNYTATLNCSSYLTNLSTTKIPKLELACPIFLTRIIVETNMILRVPF